MVTMIVYMETISVTHIVCEWTYEWFEILKKKVLGNIKLLCLHEENKRENQFSFELTPVNVFVKNWWIIGWLKKKGLNV